MTMIYNIIYLTTETTEMLHCEDFIMDKNVMISPDGKQNYCF